jgi:cell division transport system permease protein
VDAFTESFPIIGSYVDGFGGILFLVVLAVSSLSTYFSFHTVRGFLKIKRNEQE